MKGREVPSSDMLLARIVVIPKPGKDPAVCPSYRPISLINVDMKIYAKILANRLGRYIAEIVHPDQVGFVPGREAPDNIRRALNLIQVATTSGRSSFLLSLDAEKAFDRVDWNYLWAALTSFGIQGDLLKAIQALYAGPRAQVDTGGFLSAPFSILNGTRQGCPLSPLLFALSIEPLAACIREHPDVRGMEVGGKQYKLSLFADDVLLSLTSPITTLPNLLKALKDYGRVSGYKLNADKSEVLDLTLAEEERAVMRDRFPFRWCHPSMGSLGTQLTPTWGQLYKANYGVLLPTLHAMLAAWSQLHLSLFGRIYAIKMTLLPKLLYLFRTLSIPICRADLTFLQSAIHSFIWGGRRGRLPKSLMFQSKRRGGMGVPHLYSYYKAAQFAMLSMINLRSGAPLWTNLEQDMGGPQPLRTLQWTQKATPRTLHNSPTLQHSLRLWNLCREGDGLSPPGSGLQPLFYNPRFPEGNPPGAFGWWIRADITEVRDLILQGRPVTLGYLRESRALPPSETFRAVQLLYFVRSILRETPDRRLTLYETYCRQKHRGRGLISSLYTLILETTFPQDASYITRWEDDLGSSLEGNEWADIIDRTSRVTICTAVRENCYKVMARWYIHPQRLAKMYPGTPSTCFRGCDEEGTYRHAWWDCGMVSTIWTEVFGDLSRALGTPLSPNPWVALLNRPHPEARLTRGEHSLVSRVCAAVRICLARTWKGPLPRAS
uniref:Reverse transcriptase domain-containing protein n=1 Tax=Leptobrachium leishanense TaxID=445787 RepID=A0A8C5Q8T9_9ANUR